MAKDENVTAEKQPSPEPLADPAQTGDAELETLKTKAKERDEYYNKYLRAVADFENYQKRNRREQERFREDAIRDVLKELVGVVDNLDFALQSAPEGDPMAKGVKLVKDQLLKVLASRGAEPLGTKPGDAFDPDKHEAVMVEPVAGLARDEVGMVAREGYKLGSTILRPASVQVKKAAPGAAT